MPPVMEMVGGSNMVLVRVVCSILARVSCWVGLGLARGEWKIS